MAPSQPGGQSGSDSRARSAFSSVLYPAIDRIVNVTPLRKIGTGLFIAVAFVVNAFIES
jgi:hypothetical protein